jgi:fructose-bisphosphate aldolase class I
LQAYLPSKAFPSSKHNPDLKIMANSWLTAEQMAALKATADAMSAPGKGFLASDESAGPWLRAGNADAAKIPDIIENRAAYRSMLYKTPGLSEYISGVILHWETLFQSDADGSKMVDLITKNGMIPGIKLDKGYDKSGLPGTAKGPLGHAETWDKGIDDLDKRCAEAYAQGARFAKWRNVLQIDPAKGLPSELAIDVCVKNLAHYAVICQRNGLVPIVEPEIVPNGSHPIEACADATERVLAAQFAALKLYGCYLEGAVLKPNMVKNGLTGPKAPAEVVAEKTISVLKRTVPSAMPGIFFLSGETALDEDNEETATLNLNAMNKMFPNLPWSVSFSYGKALQKTCIVKWLGKTENIPVAQKALTERSKANSEACKGAYVAGSCISIGIEGNAEMQGGAY